MRISRITVTENKIPTMDINVDDVHHYILENGIVSHNSSISSGSTNGIYPIRDSSLNKTNGSMSLAYVVPEYEKYEKYYDRFWDMDMNDMNEVYAIIQKFTDQAISADMAYKIIGDEKIDGVMTMQHFFKRYILGVKTRYYMNTLTNKSIDLENTESIELNKYAVQDDFDDGECESCKL